MPPTYKLAIVYGKYINKANWVYTRKKTAGAPLVVHWLVIEGYNVECYPIELSHNPDQGIL